MKRSYTVSKSRASKRQRRAAYTVAVTRPLRKGMADGGPISTFHRYTSPASVAIMDSTAAIHGAAAITLNGLPGYTDFTSLYDQYRITAWTMYFAFDRNQAAISNTAGLFDQGLPLITIVKDFDDATALTTEDQYSQYDPVIRTRLGERIVSVSLTPRPATALYSGAFTSYGIGSRGLWVDAASPGVQYYGIKFNISPSVAGTNAVVLGYLRTWSKITVQCRATH